MKMQQKYVALLALLGLLSAPLPAAGQEDGDQPGFAGSYLSGQFAKSTGDIDRAIRYLRRAHLSDPNNVNIITQLQGLLIYNGDVEEAVALAEGMPQPNKGSALSALLVGLHAIKQKDATRAAAIFERAYEPGGGQLWMPFLSAWLDVERGLLLQPVTAASLHLDAGQDSVLVNYHLALINAQAGFASEAAANFRKAVPDDENNAPSRVMEAIVKFYRTHGAPESLTAAVDAYRGNAAEGEALAEDLSAAPTLQDGAAEVMFTMANVVQGTGALQDTVIYLQLAHYVKPDFPLVSLTLGDIYGDLKHYDRSNAAYALIGEKSKLYARARLRVAMNESRRGKSREALAQLDALIARSPASAYEALVTKADLLRAGQRFQEAADTYTQAIKQAGKAQASNWPVFFARGVCLERLGKWQAAERDLKQALSLKPDQPDVLNYLGYSWLVRHENLDEARGMIERAVKLRPNDPQIIDSMGWALYLLGKHREALPYLEHALELMPGDATINDHLGDVYWRLERRAEARYQWERALTYAPDAREAEAIRKKIKGGLQAGAGKKLAPVVADGGRTDVSVP